MAKVRMLVQPSGLINGQHWPAAGEEMQLADAVAESMAEAGTVEILDGKPVQKRPASKKAEETR